MIFLLKMNSVKSMKEISKRKYFFKIKNTTAASMNTASTSFQFEGFYDKCYHLGLFVFCVLTQTTKTSHHTFRK